MGLTKRGLVLYPLYSILYLSQVQGLAQDPFRTKQGDLCTK